MRLHLVILSIAALSLACAGGAKGGAKEGDDAGECSDDADEDADGLFDCADPDCAGASVCGEADTDTDTDTDSDTGTAPACGVGIEETWPADGATDFYYRGTIEVKLNERDPTAQIVADFDGTSTSYDDYGRLRFEPTEPLDPNTDYQVTVEGCFGAETLSFRTSDVGTPLEGDLVGRSYVVDYTDWHITEPRGIGSVLLSYVVGDYIVGVTGADANGLDFVLAASTGGRAPTQDRSVETLSFPEADFRAAPYFEVGPQDTTFVTAGYEIPIYDLYFSGTFAPDGSSIAGLTMSGLQDTRPLAPLLDDSGDPGAICDLAVSFGGACEACPSDGEPYCLPLELDRLDAPEAAGVTVVEVTTGSSMCASTQPAVGLAWMGLLALARRRSAG